MFQVCIIFVPVYVKYYFSIRILPHQQNTGAFFVAVFKKLRPLHVKETVHKTNERDMETTQSPTESKKRDNEDNFNQPQRKKRRKGVYNEDPFVFFQEEEPIWNDIKSFYKISDAFNSKCLLTRCHVGKKKNIYLTSEAIRDLVVTNQGAIKFINTGVKAFVRCDNKNMKCAFRLVTKMFTKSVLKIYFFYYNMVSKKKSTTGT